MVHNVIADAGVLLHLHRDHELGADAVDARHQHRMLITGEVDLKQSAEAADGGEHFRTARRRDFGFDAVQQVMRQIDVHAG
ncbi:hypothetical protein SDC9_184418 [bioreactor metagenome]|uniref:Uncharacterized protein n=1 Tax=bioreactor metagenome TaxID=1076179 RepID=A0A645HEE6_9ZZZZ